MLVSCLFDVLADPAEQHNIAAAHSDIVEQMSAALATYEPYVSQSRRKT